MPSHYLDPGSNHIPMSPMSVCYRDIGWSGSRNMGFTVIEQRDGDHDLPMKDFQNYMHIRVIPFACCYSRCTEVIEFVALPLCTWPFTASCRMCHTSSSLITCGRAVKKQKRPSWPSRLLDRKHMHICAWNSIHKHTQLIYACCCVHTSGHYVTVHKSV